MDSNALMQRRRSVIDVTARPGWYTIKQIAEETVAAMERRAIDEESDERGNALRREAKAARTFLNNFLNQIEAATQAEAPEKNAEVEDHYTVAID
jgi:hypothetical protein